MVRLHIDPARMAEAVVVATDEEHRYLSRVLRLGPGDAVTLFDGRGNEADAEITRIGPRAVEMRVVARRDARPRVGPELILFQGIARGDKLDLVVQKATELGVHRIVPIATGRSVVRLEAERGETRRERWRKIAREAARQCGRADVPEIDPPMEFAAAVDSVPQKSLKLMFWEDARSRRLRDALPSEGPEEIVVLIGPEGGFTEEEVAHARRAGFATVGLGPRILRTETAALAALAIVNFALGDLG